MKQILENRFKILFLFYMYTENETMMDSLQAISEIYTKNDINKLSWEALRVTVFEQETSEEYLQDIAKNETDVRWWMLFALSCEHDNDPLCDILDKLKIKLDAKHPQAKSMLTYLEAKAVDIFELKEPLAELN
jgi:hypothetical protein